MVRACGTGGSLVHIPRGRENLTRSRQGRNGGHLLSPTWTRPPWGHSQQQGSGCFFAQDVSHQVCYIVTNLNHTDSLTSKDCHVVLAGMPTVLHEPIGGSPLRCGGTVGVAGGGRCQSLHWAEGLPSCPSPQWSSIRPSGHCLPTTSPPTVPALPWPRQLVAHHAPVGGLQDDNIRPGDTALQLHPSPTRPAPSQVEQSSRTSTSSGTCGPGQLIFLPHHASPDGCWPRWLTMATITWGSGWAEHLSSPLGSMQTPGFGSSLSCTCRLVWIRHCTQMTTPQSRSGRLPAGPAPGIPSLCDGVHAEHDQALRPAGGPAGPGPRCPCQMVPPQRGGGKIQGWWSIRIYITPRRPTGPVMWTCWWPPSNTIATTPSPSRVSISSCPPPSPRCGTLQYSPCPSGQRPGSTRRFVFL